MEIKKHGNSGNKSHQKLLLSTLVSIQAKLTQAKIKVACPFATNIVTGMVGGGLFYGASNHYYHVITLNSNAAVGDTGG